MSQRIAKAQIVIIVSGIRKSLQLEWVAQSLKQTNRDLTFVLMGEMDTPFFTFLENQKIQVFQLRMNGSRDGLRVFFETLWILFRTRPRVVHTHLFHANAIGLMAAWLLGIRKRIHTRHHTAYHHYYFPRTVKIDKWINRISTDIIVLCDRGMDVVIGWEKTPARKVHRIPHGFKLAYFSSVEESRVQRLRARHKIPTSNKFVIGVIARYTHFKGVQYIIPAFRRLVTLHPEAHLILVNAGGDYANEIRKLLLELPQHSYTEIAFEEDVAALYKLFSIYVHVPIDPYVEAFGQTYVEALASGVPSIFTLSGIACDFIRAGINAVVIPYQDDATLFQAMDDIAKDSNRSLSLVQQGLESVQPFNLPQTMTQLQRLYEA